MGMHDLQFVSYAELAPIVAKIIGFSRIDVLARQVQRMSTGGSHISGVQELCRITSFATSAEQSVCWPFVVKTVQQSNRLLDMLCCYATIEQPNSTWQLWLEDNHESALAFM